MIIFRDTNFIFFFIYLIYYILNQHNIFIFIYLPNTDNGNKNHIYIKINENTDLFLLNLSCQNIFICIRCALIRQKRWNYWIIIY